MVDDDMPSLDRRSFVKAGTAGAVGAATVTNVQAGREPGPKENELIAGVDASVETATAASSIQSETPSMANVVHRNDTLSYVAVEIPEVADEQAKDNVRRQLEARPDVKYVEENKTVELHSTTPDDPLYDQQYAPQQVRAPEAWDLLGEYGSDDVTIAVVDTGTDYEHETLASRFDSNVGYDYVDDNDDPMPPSSRESHGTHVSGIASATSGNGTGTAGISNSQLYSLRALGGRGGSISDIADSIQWAADNGADLINMSLGGGGSNETMQQAVSYAYDEGVLLLASAGNDGGRGVAYPSAYDEVMSISAIDENENLADFSDYGPEVELTGPGVDVLSTYPNDDYESISGTSMSCPAVTGVAALGLAADPSLSNDELRVELRETARDVGLGDEEQGAGCADAAALVESLLDGSAPGGVSADLDASTTSADLGETVTLDASGSSSQGGAIVSYDWTVDGDAVSAGESLELSRDVETTVTVEVEVTNEDGESDSDSESITFSEDVPTQAVIDASPSNPDPGQTVDLDGTSSVAGTGDIAEYEWSTARASVTGPTASLTRDEEVDVDVTLEVTDDAGESDATTTTISFGGEEEPGEVSADISVDDPEPVVGQEVTFDGSGSTSENGAITEYDWESTPGGTATGETVTGEWDEPGDVEMVLTVTDEIGETDTTSLTITVEEEEDDGGDCGDETGGGSVEGSLSWWNSSDSYTYASQTSDPCQINVDLDGPSDADFDLYVTLDGRTPTTSDYDKRSITPDSQEEIIIQDPEPGTEIGILVTSYSGSGSYLLSVDELGK